MVVIANALWSKRLGADPSIIGRALTLDGKPYTVVGVLPPGFQLPQAPKLGGAVRLTTTVDAFVPLRLSPGLGWVGDFNQVALGRLKRSVTPEQSRAELDIVQRRVAAFSARRTDRPPVITGNSKRRPWPFVVGGAAGLNTSDSSRRLCWRRGYVVNEPQTSVVLRHRTSRDHIRLRVVSRAVSFLTTLVLVALLGLAAPDLCAAQSGSVSEREVARASVSIRADEPRTSTRLFAWPTRRPRRDCRPDR